MRKADVKNPNFAIVAEIAMLFLMLFAIFVATNATKATLPHSGENVTLLMTKNEQSGLSFSITAENFDKWERTISYQKDGTTALGAESTDVVLRYIDSEVGYVFIEKTAGEGYTRVYECLKGECPPFTKQAYEPGNGGDGERMTTCYKSGAYETTSRAGKTDQYSTVIGKGCPID